MGRSSGALCRLGGVLTTSIAVLLCVVYVVQVLQVVPVSEMANTGTGEGLSDAISVAEMRVRVVRVGLRQASGPQMTPATNSSVT